MIQPVQKHLLVELRGAYKHVNPTEEQFGTSKIRGVLKAMAKDITPAVLKEIGAEDLKVGDTVYFGKYEDSASFQIDGNDHILIKLEEIGGRSAAQ